MPSARPEHQESPSVVSLGREGLATLGVSAAGESPRTHPQGHDIGSMRRQALLAATTTATALIDTVSLPAALSVAPVSTGQQGSCNMGYPLPGLPGLLSRGTQYL